MVMGWRIIFSRRVLMARSANLVARSFHFEGMWVMAIAATNPLVVHLALKKGTVFIDFVFDLSVVEVSCPVQLFQIVIPPKLVSPWSIDENLAAAMTMSTRLHLRF
jgi:hypothetical protein